MSNLYRRSGAYEAPCSDPIPIYVDGEYHVFHLSPPYYSLGTVEAQIRSRDTQRHIVSRDLVHWKVLRPALLPGQPGDIDEDGCWTGSCIKKDGIWYLFYCAFDYDAENPQKICLATSEDGEHFTKHPDFPTLRPASWLEQIDYRDSYVFWNEDENTYWMILAARYADGGPFHRRGTITYRTSDDLWNWSEDHELYSPWSIVCPECPEMFKLGDYWYLCFSHFGENAKTTYRVSKSCHGPWRVPKLPGFDGRRFYAAKTLYDGKRRVQWGNIYEREELTNKSRWTYAGDMALPRELVQKENGDLAVKVVPEIVESFSEKLRYTFRDVMGEWKQEDGSICTDATGTFAYGFFEEDAYDAVLLKTTLVHREGNAAFGIIMKSPENLTPCWELVFEPDRSRVAISRYPMALDPFWVGLNPKLDLAPMEVDGPKHVERPLQIKEGDEIEVKVFIHNSCVECFVNDELALSFRIYDPDGEIPFYHFGLFVEDGILEAKNTEICMESCGDYNNS